MNELTNWTGRIDNQKIEFGLSIEKNRLLIDSLNEADFFVEKEMPNFYFPIDYAGENLVHMEFDNSVEKADRIDYGLAVSCGVITGLVDVLQVSPFSLDETTECNSDKLNNLIKWGAKACGFEGDDIPGAIKHLRIILDNGENDLTDKVVDMLEIEIKDLGNHYSIVGMLFSIVTQFTGKVFGINEEGNISVTKVGSRYRIGKNIPQKICYGVLRWVLGLVKMRREKNLVAGDGAGIPQPILDFLDDLSSSAVFDKYVKKDHKIFELFDEAFEDIEWDVDVANIDIVANLSKQAAPVLINECLVRTVYYLRRLLENIKETGEIELDKIDIKSILKANNRTITRMLTVASGTFTAVDTCGAAIKSAIKNDFSVKNPMTWVDFAVNINLVGIGCFVVSCRRDALFIIEDIEEMRQDVSNPLLKSKLDSFENSISDLGVFTLVGEQVRVQDSLMLMKIDYDIRQSKGEKDYEEKIEWRDNWLRVTFGEGKIEQLIDSYFILDESRLYASIENELMRTPNHLWLYTLTLHAEMFQLYTPLGSENDKSYRKLKISDDYIKNVFSARQKYIYKNFINSLEKSRKYYFDKLTNGTLKKVRDAAATTGVAAAVGILAFMFAPEIATTLVGGTIAGGTLSGAALTNASLAFFGGGSLVSGGLGMAGGTTVISGGGAILGALTGKGAATTRLLLATEGAAAKSCAEVLTLCKEVLIEQYGAYGLVLDIKTLVEQRMYDINSIIIQIEKNAGKKPTEEEKKYLEKSRSNYKYFEKCNNLLQLLLDERMK